MQHRLEYGLDLTNFILFEVLELFFEVNRGIIERHVALEPQVADPCTRTSVIRKQRKVLRWKTKSMQNVDRHKKTETSIRRQETHRLITATMTHINE